MSQAPVDGDLRRLLDAIGRHKKCPEDVVVTLQSALTACRALGPANNGPGEMEKARFIAGWLADLGVSDLQHVNASDARAPQGTRPNLIAVIKGKTPRTLWLFGHMDVVPPGDAAAWTSDPWQLRRDGDRLYGRGTEDNQQAIVSMLLLAKELRALNITPQLTLGLVFMSDEETGSRYGLGHVLEHAADLFKPDDLYIVPDAGSPESDTIEVAEKSQLWLKVQVTGTQCHASTPHKGRNAFIAASDMALACNDKLPAIFSAKDTLFNPPDSTFVMSKHDANVPNINTMPGSDVFYMDCRLLPNVSTDAVIGEVRGIAKDVAARRDVGIEVSVVSQQAPSSVDVSSPVVSALTDAVERVYRVCPRPVGIGGATVAAQLRYKGLPAAVWSTLDNTCHQPDEYSSISATVKDAQVFAHILMFPHV